MYIGLLKVKHIPSGGWSERDVSKPVRSSSRTVRHYGGIEQYNTGPSCENWRSSCTHCKSKLSPGGTIKHYQRSSCTHCRSKLYICKDTRWVPKRSHGVYICTHSQLLGTLFSELSRIAVIKWFRIREKGTNMLRNLGKMGETLTTARWMSL